MKYNIAHTQSWYSIIIAILTIGFLLVLTTSTLNLVLQEMQDGKGKQDYMKAYAAAEGWLELAMLQIKDKGYWYFWEIKKEKLLWNSSQDGLISYSFDSKVSTYSWTLDAFQTNIIPLFWIDNLWLSQSVSFVNLNTQVWIIWNIIWESGGISGTWNITSITSVWEKTLKTIAWNTDFQFIENKKVHDFINSNTWSYLMLYNPLSSNISYNIESGNMFFTKPIATISSSAQVSKYVQNLETTIDNTEFLGILKYSIYSWN